MTTAVFDTLKASDTLKAAGIEAKQAEAIVHTMAGAFEDTVATKADLGKLESSVKTDTTSLKAEFKRDITEVRADVDKLKVSVRADMEKLEASTKAIIAEVRTELKQDIASVKGDIKLLKWMIGVILVCVAFPILKSFLV